MSTEHKEHEEFIKRQDDYILGTLPQFTEGVLRRQK